MQFGHAILLPQMGRRINLCSYIYKSQPDLSPMKHKLSKDNLALIVFFFIFLAISLLRYSDNVPGVISSDTEGYYMYLPAVFIQKSVHHVAPGDMNYRKNAKGEVIIKYTCGVAYFYLPFFLGAHIIAHFYHLNASGSPGFSFPYFYGIIICGVFWAFVGVFLLQRLLLKFFSRRVAWITILCIVLGTNFFHYATISVSMSHIYSFTLTAGILVLTCNYYRNPAKPTAVLMSLLFGLLILIRPTNCVLLVFVLLFNVASTRDLKQRYLFFKSHLSDLLFAIPFFIIPIIPQMIYWKTMTGRWIVYSYEGENFIFWRSPKIAAVLFDTQNGLFLYSPILLFVFFGLFAGRKDHRTNFIGVSIVFIGITYIFASWWAWWFGGAFGHRCYIEYFPVLAFPFAVAVEKIDALKMSFKMPFIIILVLFIYYSVAMSFLYGTTQIWDGPGWRWNWLNWAHEVEKIF